MSTLANKAAAKRPSLEITGEIQKSYSSRLRISLSSWRGKHNIELRECSSVIGDIYFPTSSGVTLEISKLPELIEVLKVALTEAKKRGLLVTAR
jgi:hypothetical protein